MVRTGLDTFISDPTPWTRGGRVGLVCHAASVLPDLQHAVDVVARDPRIHLIALFGPQHGLTAHTQDNMIEWQGGHDPRTGLPLYSLYGEVRKPTPPMLEDVDVMVVDLQDVGTRVYTFAWTMAHVMEACAELGKRVVVLDRPNPIGGAVEGPMLDESYRSFVGLYPIPLRHGLTVSELALYLNEHCGIGCDLEVVWMDGWRRDQWFDETGLPWVMPSPNMPTLDTAIVYPGAVLFEGTTLSEGRGTTRPFELIGAPGIDGHALADALTAAALPGVRFRSVTFEPAFQKHAGALCGGVQIHVTDRQAFQPVLTTAVMLTALAHDWSGAWGWREPPYEYVHDRLPIDILAGSPQLRQGVAEGWAADMWRLAWEPDLARFRGVRTQYLHYD